MLASARDSAVNLCLSSESYIQIEEFNVTVTVCDNILDLIK